MARKLSMADVINAGARVLEFQRKPSPADRALALAQMVGSMMLHGEKRPDGSLYDQSPEDAAETLAMVIRQARAICTTTSPANPA